MDHNKNFLVIVLTGGPCGGKTSSFVEIKKLLEGLDYKIFTVPEVSTLLLSNGGTYPGESNRNDLLIYESSLLQLEINLQNTFFNIASLEKTKKKVILCDRGTLDVKAYMPIDVWEEVLGNLDETEKSLLSKYDLICHLTSTANGAEEFYSNQNNHVRLENSEEAKLIDIKTLNCWNDHPNRFIVDNPKEGGFEKKMENLKNYIINFISSY